MATHRIGLFSDFHYPNVANSTYRADLDHLWNTLATDTMVFGGDQLAGDEPAVPHSSETDIRGFWEDVVEPVSGGLIDEVHALPGNHEVPYTYWQRISREYIGDRVETKRRLQPVDGLTILLIKTQSYGLIQGGKEAVAQDYCRIPFHELRWLRNELSEARSRGDVTVVIGHSPVTFATDSGLNSYHPQASKTKVGQYQRNSTAYEVIANFDEFWNATFDHLPIVYLSSHDYQEGVETYRNVDGLYHTWQDHYSVGPSTFSYLDVDTSTGNVTYKTVESSDYSENTVMDVTPSW